jgi:hypothetical protein
MKVTPILKLQIASIVLLLISIAIVAIEHYWVKNVWTVAAFWISFSLSVYLMYREHRLTKENPTTLKGP